MSCKFRLFFTSAALVCISTLVPAQCVMTIQPGPTDGKDALLFSLDCNSSYAQSSGACDTTNMGNAYQATIASWTWWSTPANMRSIMEFDLSAILATGCTVSNAKLYLPHDGYSSSYNCGTGSTLHPCIDNSIGLYRVTQPWDEQTVTWVNQPAFASTNPGTDFLTLPNDGDPYDTYIFDLTDMVNGWLTGAFPNNGIVMKHLVENSTYKRVSPGSSDHPDSTRRPYLVLELNCPNVCNNIISGKVFHDYDASCSQDAGDYGLAGWMIKVTPGPMYAITDANGNYELSVPSGTYMVEQIIPNPNIWDVVCPTPNYSYGIMGLVGGDTASAINFAVDAEVLCPELWVDIGAGNLRPYHLESYYVEYCNNGNDTSYNTFIDLTFDTLLLVQSSSVPWTSQNGNTYHYDLGTLLPGECGTFNLVVEPNSLAGPTLCVEALIGPVLNCSQPADTTWDQSSVSVEGYCADSLACFTILNTGDPGDGDMEGTSEFRIYENNILVYAGTFQLEGGEDTVICWPANGNDIQLQADQRPGHPGNSHPNDHVEGCGTPGSSSPAWGYVNNVPLDDEDVYVEIDCQEVISSYDPNDKTVVPEGWGSQHYINAEDELEYRIRFQNTGNDTAFVIVIRDTLSPYLDPSTVVSGVSSHNYEFAMFGNGILQWTFNNILLPDSTTDESGSHGFVKFKVKQVPGNIAGTLIENLVGIYFDFNPPVITNVAFSTIYEAGETVEVNHIEYQMIDLQVYPNPASDLINFEFINAVEMHRDLMIYDATGRVVYHEVLTRNQTAVHVGSFESGLYIFTLTENGKPVSSGKLIIE